MVAVRFIAIINSGVIYGTISLQMGDLLNQKASEATGGSIIFSQLL